MTTGKIAGLSGDTLKWIAIVTMFIDHFAYVYVNPLSSAYMVLRGIGRLAFPIYCFLLVEGFRHTSNYAHYLVRLTLFALISEIPFDLALYGVPFYWGYQNVMLTMLIGLAGLGAYQWCVNRQMPIYAIMVVIAAMVTAWLIDCDYGAEGVLLIFMFYLFQNSPMKRVVALGFWCVLFGGLEIWGAAAALPLALYNGKRGDCGRWFKWFGYAFYPLHLFLLWLGTVI